MRAVNLLPADLRRAGSGGGSGSGAGAYALLGALALALIVVSAWAISSRQVTDRGAEVARLNAEAAAAEAQAGSLSSYEQTVKVAQTRRQAVVSLIEGRFDWAGALEDVSRTVPDNAWLTSITGTTAPGVAVEGGGSNPLRASVAAPAIEVIGCTTSHEEVSRLISRLRAMKGVTRVALATSEKNDSAGDAGRSDSAGATANGDCTAGSDQRPKFNLVVFYGTGQTAATTDEGETTTASETASGGAQ
jgi:Tfp pilus assembly protein PilN